MANQAAVWAAERCPESLHNSRVTTPYQRGAFLDAVQTSIWEMPTQVPAGTTCYHLHRADTLNGTSVTKWILWRIANFAFNTQFFGGVAQNVAYTADPSHHHDDFGHSPGVKSYFKANSGLFGGLRPTPEEVAFLGELLEDEGRRAAAKAVSAAAERMTASRTVDDSLA